MTANAERFMVAAIRDAAARLGVDFRLMSDDWLIRLERDGRVRFAIGYDCGLNTSAAAKIAIDKTATASVLEAAGVPHVPVHIFFQPDMHYFVEDRKTLGDAHALYHRLGRDVVAKPNEGTGGNMVFRCRAPRELDSAFLTILAKHRAMVLSPFQRIVSEVRCIVLGDEARFVFEKQRATVTGDGATPVSALIAAYLDGHDMPAEHKADAAETAAALAGEAGYTLTDPLPIGETLLIDWRHNLARGASAAEIGPADPRHAAASGVAVAGARALGITFASVDVVLVGGEWRVLEINSGVTVNKMAAQLDNGPARAQALYDDIVRRLFDL